MSEAFTDEKWEYAKDLLDEMRRRDILTREDLATLRRQQFLRLPQADQDLILAAPEDEQVDMILRRMSDEDLLWWEMTLRYLEERESDAPAEDTP